MQTANFYKNLIPELLIELTKISGTNAELVPGEGGQHYRYYP